MMKFTKMKLKQRTGRKHKNIEGQFSKRARRNYANLSRPVLNKIMAALE